jgi:hypothetical protein
MLSLGPAATNTLLVAGLIAAVAGALALLAAALWLCSLLLPELVWATVKRLPLGDPFDIDRAAAVVAMSRRAWTLRIPLGVRIIVSLGGERTGQAHLLDDLYEARRLRREREELADANS